MDAAPKDGRPCRGMCPGRVDVAVSRNGVKCPVHEFLDLRQRALRTGIDPSLNELREPDLHNASVSDDQSAGQTGRFIFGAEQVVEVRPNMVGATSLHPTYSTYPPVEGGEVAVCESDSEGASDEDFTPVYVIELAANKWPRHRALLPVVPGNGDQHQAVPDNL